jgi:hypothetical protein
MSDPESPTPAPTPPAQAKTSFAASRGRRGPPLKFLAPCGARAR